MKFVAGSVCDRISLAICEQVGIEPSQVRRIVIDLEVGTPARVYYETFADDEHLAVALEGGLTLVGTEEEATA